MEARRAHRGDTPRLGAASRIPVGRRLYSGLDSTMRDRYDVIVIVSAMPYCILICIQMSSGEGVR